jgi:hypothetical protein
LAVSKLAADTVGHTGCSVFVDFLKLVETEVDENGGNVAATEMQILAQMLAKIYAKMHAIEQRQR